MLRKTASIVILSLLVISAVGFAYNVQPVKSDYTWTQTIYIQADGSISPPTAPISSVDNVTYTLTDNIVGSVPVNSSAIIIQRDSVIIDGAGHTLQGTQAAGSEGVDLTGGSDVTLKNMRITAFHYGIALYSSDNNSVSGNDITANSWDGIFFVSSDNNSVSGNDITANSVNGIEFQVSSSNSLSENDIASNGYNGVWFASSSNNSVIGNDVTANNETGIGLDSFSNDNSVNGNDITANGWSGIKLSYYSNYNSLSGNDMAANGLDGIKLESSSNNSISENDVSANSLNGVEFGSSSNNSVSGNNITVNDDYGIYLTSSLNNTIYHNNFINNTGQVYSSGSTNVWDNGYPSGGNFWSDYAGLDVKSGPDQDQPGSDGIGDTPYNISVNNVDHYPLMWSWGSPPPVAYAELHSQTRYSWPMFEHDMTHTGYIESPSSQTNATMWTYPAEGFVFSSAAVADGMVYVGLDDDEVYCLNASTGALVWSYTTADSGGDFSSSPAVSCGVVYVGSGNGNLYALDAATGAFIWSYTTGGYVYSSPTVDYGMVYVGSDDDRVYCLDASTGALAWSYATGGGVFSSPAVAGGMVYVGSLDNKTYCLNAMTGAQVWNYTTGSAVYSSPAVVGGVVYVGSDDDNVYALNAATGALMWNYSTGSYVFSSPAVVGGVVYVGSDDDNVYALNATTGAQVWNYTTGGGVGSSPAVAGDQVYVGSDDDRVYCLEASTGALVWSYATGGGVLSSPAISDGMVFVSSIGSTLYAFGQIVMAENYASVQAAINAAPPGATVLVAPATYHESLIINKTVTILGMLGSEPTFSGGGSGIAITIVSSGSGSVIAGITVTDWAQGILVNGASGCQIYDNIVSLISQNGIVVQGFNASNNFVYDNIFEQDTVAVSLASSTSDNTITGNMISLSNVGLNLQSSGNIVYANIMTYNVVAINITNSNNNLFFHNDFISSNFTLTISNSTGNVWDNGYPSGGNYWSDYLTQNPNASENDSSGIWNTPYVVATGDVDYYPLVTPYSLHNIGIASLVLSKTVIGRSSTPQMSVLQIRLKILNPGTYEETFTLTVAANSTLLTQQSVSLSQGDYTSLNVTWNTADCAMGNYTIAAYVELAEGETNMGNNNVTGGNVIVTIPGDLNGDGTVNILDAIALSNAFGSTPGSANWNANADINGDGTVNILDAIILSNNFGQSIT